MNATTEQIGALRARAVNAITREIMAHGVTLTHEQADELGEETLAWMGGRLGLNVRETDRGVECTPPKSYTGEESRRAGIETKDESSTKVSNVSADLAASLKHYETRVSALGGYGVRVSARMPNGKLVEGQLIELGFGGYQPGILADDGTRYRVADIGQAHAVACVAK